MTAEGGNMDRTKVVRYISQFSWIRDMLIRGSESAIMSHYLGRGVVATYDKPRTPEESQKWDRALLKWTADRVDSINIFMEDCDLGLPLHNADMSLAGLRSMRITVTHRLHISYRIDGIDLMLHFSSDDSLVSKTENITYESLFKLIIATRANGRTIQVLGIADEIWLNAHGIQGHFFDIYVVPQNREDPRAIVIESISSS